MQLKHIVLAVGAVLAAPSAMAAALTANNVIYIGGASAQTPGLAQSVVKFCSSTVQTYIDDQDGKQGFAYYCATPSATATAAGLSGSFIIVKLDAGGSANGVGPVVNKQAINFPDISNCGSTSITGYNAKAVVGTLAGQCAYKTAPTAIVPQLGLSDVSVATWEARNQFTPSTTAFTEVSGFAGQGFGLAVSPTLYSALQLDQFGSSCVGNTTVACQPSISATQYAAITAANPGSYYQGGADGNGVVHNPSAALFLNPANAPSGVLNLCRRDILSGTQASSEIYFLSNPCSASNIVNGNVMNGLAAPVRAGLYDSTGAVVTSGGVFNVVENSSTGNAKTCLGSGVGIGVLSLENGQAITTTGWNWVKLNGVSPNVEGTAQKQNTVNGLYDYAFETSMIYRNDAPSTDITFATALTGLLGDGNNLASFSGIYADPTSGAAYVAGQTHKGSRGGNVCAKHTMYF